VPDGPDGLAGNTLRAAIAGLVLFVVGLVLGGGALEVDRRDREVRSGLLSAEGTVVAQIKRQTPEGPTFAPLISFVTAAGERISFTGNATDTSTYHLGAKVPVLYEPGNPAGARINTFGARRLRTLVAGVVAVLLMALGGYVAWYARQLDAQRSAGL
jgi:hypothetical protein